MLVPSAGAAAALALLSGSALLVSAHPTNSAAPESHWEKRAKIKKSNTVTTPISLSGKTFDYVIVGGGTAGLVIASRLSENASISVAVIEAGTDGSDVEFSILAPGQAYFDGIATVDSVYDWGYDTSAQSQLNGREIYWPRGKIVGGSSAVNGEYSIRHSSIEQNSWAKLVNDDRWSFDSVWPYMYKSETSTPPSEANIAASGFVYNATSHGHDGPIHYGYPGYFYPQSNSWLETLGNLGVAATDPGYGNNFGAFCASSAIDSTSGNWTRSYSKTGYLDPAASRTNLVVLTGYQATRILFDGSAATGVEFASSATGTRYNVTASTEVVLSAGVIGTPQLLQVSGVGDATLLGGLGIDVVADLPGVGMHLTDHLSAEITYSGTDLVTRSGDMVINSASYAEEQRELWYAGDNSSLYNSPNDMVAYVNLSTILGATEAETFLAQAKANASASVAAYTTNAYVQAGYNATYYGEIDTVLPSDVGAVEILSSNTGTYGSFATVTNKTLSIQAAIQHPLSRGYVKINSTSTFDKPIINPNYLTHPADIQVLIAAFKYARTIGSTAPYSKYVLHELSPGSSVQTDAEWETWLRKSLSTEYHPASSASMLPYEFGGVVSPDLLVYNTTKLRIVDSSIVPVGLSAHMTAPLYGIAERAYGIMVGLDSASSSPDSASATLSATSATGSSAASAQTSTSSKGKSTKTTSTTSSPTQSKTAQANAAQTSTASSGATGAVAPGLFSIAAVAGGLVALLA